MVQILVMTDVETTPAEVLPALDLLSHRARLEPVRTSADRLRAAGAEVVLIDGRRTLAGARGLARTLAANALELPVLMVLTEGGMAAVGSSWAVDDIVLDTAGPAEVEARLRLAVARFAAAGPDQDQLIRAGVVTIDESAYSAHVDGQALNLTYKEFELLKFLAQNPGRVFTRAQLLAEVWGYDYYGGTRTVDVHVRRLRSKLGSDHDQMIATVRNVGYSLSAERGSRG